MTFLAQRIELDPTVEQRIFLAKACGTAIFAYNWALDLWEKKYKAGEKVDEMSLRREWTQKRPDWAPQVGGLPAKNAIKNLGEGFRRMFIGLAKHPTKHKKGKNSSFQIDNGAGTKVTATHVTIPKLGDVRLKETPRWLGAPARKGIVSREAGRWFVSIQFDLGEDYRRTPAPNRNAVIGVDLGIKTAVVLSDGQTFSAPKPLKKHTRRLKIRQRRISRRVKKSKNRKKACYAVARLHRRIKNIRKDFLHKTTCKIARENQTVKIEDLSVKGMMANHKLAKAIADIGFYEFRRQLAYKLPLYGGNLVVIDRWAPTTQTCSCCGKRREVNLTLKDRTFTCDDPKCGFVMDRDLNAARNIANFSVPGVTGEITPARSQDVMTGVSIPYELKGRKPNWRIGSGARQRRNNTCPKKT